MLAEALADYRRSVELLEKLLADSPGDPKIRRYLAEALGLGNMGCCLRTALRLEEAESLYRRAIQIRRELLCGTGSERRRRRPRRTDVPGELDDLLYLVSTVHLMAGLLEARAGWRKPRICAEQLEDDIVAAVRAVVGTEDSRTRRRIVGSSAHIGAASHLRRQPASGYDDQSPTGVDPRPRERHRPQ